MVARLVALFQSLTVINEEFVTDNKQYFYIWFNLTVQSTNSVQVCQFCSTKFCVYYAAFYLCMCNTAFMYLQHLLIMPELLKVKTEFSVFGWRKRERGGGGGREID